MNEPQVYKYMSPLPHSIGRDQPLARAHELMRKHRIRHLPVLDGGVLVGLVSQRDLHFIETLRDVDPEEVLVEEAMTPDPFFVAPETPLREAVVQMAEHKYGATVVMDGARIVGVLTAVDALRALAELLASTSTMSCSGESSTTKDEPGSARVSARRSSRASSAPRRGQPSTHAARPRKASG
jgi:acetoin utilization protein AcuB